MNTITTEVGSFHLESGQMIVTDPCYDPDTKCAGLINNARPGKWNASIDYADIPGWGERNWTLVVSHSDAKKSELTRWSKCPFRVGVDSGQAGVFDLARYPKTERWRGRFGDEGTFYDSACKLTLSDTGAGCIEFGAVSSSGLGDGGYSAYAAQNTAGETIGVMIVFINEADFYDSEDGS